MADLPRVSKHGSADLAFAWQCLLAGAVTFDEFRAWAEHVITLLPAEYLPPHMIDLMMAEERRDVTAFIAETIGFVPRDTECDDGAQRAIWGITALRGTHRPDDAGMSAKAARALLSRHPEVPARFLRTFPFLTLPEAA
ncbi:hypothetical protein roselon_00421 [Roseibacterium elongatum DSM 19469]|uniref:Uncharacterized protein n=1 Tax=Roseicyclus elongatus DSM 19469 TaxID=1294273 RepID=W8S2A1_9RHOB|nr:hypothetical protein [Roseibacterium elongatum]AHM02866.1 hypothetical protein roselon_00421 [Roseibacterium elongatum DSM 19469]